MSTLSKSRQIEEIIKCGKDPLYFIEKYVKIQHPTRGLIPFHTYDYQKKCLENFVDNRFNIVLKARQLGMSTISAAYSTWLALFHKDKNILVIATKLTVAQNFIKKVKTIYGNIPTWLILPQLTSNNKTSLEFSHGSSIKAVPTSDDAGRSESLSLLIIDEAAFVKNFDDLWMGLYPTLATGGRSIIISTPNGVGGMYHKIYTDAEAGLNEFYPTKLKWDVHPDYDDKWFKEQKRNLGSDRKVAQELLCDFVASGDTFLSMSDIKWLGEMVKQPIDRAGEDKNVWIWEYPLSEHKYIISADIARGDSKDYSAFHVIDVTSDTVVAEYKGKLPPDRFGELLFETGHRYNTAMLCPENNSFGYATLMKLKDLKYPRIYNPKMRPVHLFSGYQPVDDDQKAGFNTNGKTRIQILSKLEEVLRNKSIAIYSSRFFDEIKTFVYAGGRAQAMRNRNDDLVMSLAIGLWLFDTSSEYGKHGSDLNNAMLEAMSVTTRPYSNVKNNGDDVKPSFNPFAQTDGRNRVYREASEEEVKKNFKWLYK